MSDASRPAERFRALHYADGRGVCGWYGVEPVSRRLWMLREWCPADAMGPAAFARGVAERSAGERFSGTWAGPELFAGKEGEPRTCDTFSGEGVDCYEAPGDAASRAERLLDYLEPVWHLLADGKQEQSPRLMFAPECVRSVRAFPAQVGSVDPLVLIAGYAVMSRDASEGRRVNVDEQMHELAERGTRERERERERRQQFGRKRGRFSWLNVR